MKFEAGDLILSSDDELHIIWAADPSFGYLLGYISIYNPDGLPYACEDSKKFVEKEFTKYTKLHGLL